MREEIEKDMPCPFCGGTEITSEHDDGLCWKKCAQCGATGPAQTRYSDEDSPDWNTRQALQHKGEAEQLPFVWMRPDDAARVMISTVGERAEIAPDKEPGFTVPLYRNTQPSAQEIGDAVAYGTDLPTQKDKSALMDFYGVDSEDALLSVMAKHIEKLQHKSRQENDAVSFYRA